MKNIAFYCLLLFCLLFAAPALQAQQELYSRVKIFTGNDGMALLAGLGLPVDHCDYKQGAYLVGEFSESELKLVEASGFIYEVLQPDMAEFYRRRNEKPVQTPEKSAEVQGMCQPVLSNFPTPTHFQLGSMGGFFTYTEMLAHLDTMHSLFSGLISAIQPIEGFATQEGNPVYWVKISDNPQTDEPGEPQILLTALHHAREPASLSQMIFLMYYLLENYETDPNIAYLIDNSEIYIVPCLNPDGYQWNEFTNPDGGGMWRKNRRDNTDGTYGVDLNRNYGFLWGYDDNGSSPNTNSSTYRGTSAFSEPETQAVKMFCETKQFQIALNYHSSGNLLIYPWGYVPSFQTPDSTLFRAYAREMTRENNFVWGTGNETVGYLTNGVSDDWMYGEQETKSKIFSFTPEIGRRFEDGFWPSTQRIIPICQSTMWQNLSAIRFLHNYGLLAETNGQYLNTTDTVIHFTLNRIGLQDGGTFTVSLVPQSSNIVAAGEQVVVSGLELEQIYTGQIGITLSDTIAQGSPVSFKLLLNNGQGLILEQNITKHFGTPVIAYANQCTDLNSWQTSDNANWGLTGLDYVSESTSMTDSPDGNYLSDDLNTLTLTDTIDLTQCSFAELRFWAKWAIEPSYDMVQMQAVDLASGTITPLCGKYTHMGTPNQFNGEPVYDGIQPDWVEEVIDLSDFAGALLQLRLVLVSDNAVEYDGFYFDDLVVEKLPVAAEPATAAPAMAAAHGGLMLLPCVPNPTTTQTNIYVVQPQQAPTPAELVITNPAGIVVLRQPIAPLPGKNCLQINTQYWSSGLYFYYVQNSTGKTPARKMMVVNQGND
ncbi:hypothetical protein C7N43_20125 [Sphingobacteriales bacterium UPWRP_1]|nr:hypothetical protein BVG80_02520 [Sphingobacteriales bacterium TSM_CSM]PSJ75228.1 hypothetical protein C7N43_20125 [Sphingobacteriales bacterium UPWRP_1]